MQCAKYVSNLEKELATKDPKFIVSNFKEKKKKILTKLFNHQVHQNNPIPTLLIAPSHSPIDYLDPKFG